MTTTVDENSELLTTMYIVHGEVHRKNARLCKGKVGNTHGLTTRYLVIHETQVDKEQIKWIKLIVESVVSIFFSAVEPAHLNHGRHQEEDAGHEGGEGQRYGPVR